MARRKLVILVRKVPSYVLCHRVQTTPYTGDVSWIDESPLKYNIDPWMTMPIAEEGSANAGSELVTNSLCRNFL